MRFFLPLLFLFLLFQNTTGQTQHPADSIILLLDKAKTVEDKSAQYTALFSLYEYNDTLKARQALEAMLTLSSKYGYQEGIANAYYYFGYYYQDVTQNTSAIDYFKSAIMLYQVLIKGNIPAQKTWYYKDRVSSCYNCIGLSYNALGDYTDAVESYKRAIAVVISSDNKVARQNALLNMGSSYYYMGNYPEAMTSFQQCLKLSEELKDDLTQANCYNNIALVVQELGDFKQGAEYLIKSLAITEKTTDYNSVINTCSNLGICYRNLKNNKKALMYYEKGLKVALKVKDEPAWVLIYNNIGNLYRDSGLYDLGLKYYNDALPVAERLGDKSAISSLYLNIALIDIKLGRYKEAIKKLLVTSGIASEEKMLDRLRESYETLAEAYEKDGDVFSAIKYIDLAVDAKDSLMNSEKARQLSDMEKRYQAEKKQLIIGSLENEKALQLSKYRKQRVLIYAFIIGFVLIVFFSVSLYRQILQKKKTYRLLAIRNAEILQKNEEITSQRDEIEAQREDISAQHGVVTKQKELIQEINHEITDSIRYALRIQQAVLPATEQLSDFFPGHFVLFKPKDIVSGDFYLTWQKEKIKVFCVAGCTGHGVPGALLSMLGMTLLNQVMRDDRCDDPAKVLIEFRMVMNNALQHHSKTNSPVLSESVSATNDGIDISLCFLNTENLKLQFAGTGNTVFIMTNSGFISGNSRLIQWTGDDMTIGNNDCKESFHLQELMLSKDDTIYITSKGILNQEGGYGNGPLGTEQLSQWILNMSNSTLEKQKQDMEKLLDEWKGSNEQTDDITFLGFKV